MQYLLCASPQIQNHPSNCPQDSSAVRFLLDKVNMSQMLLTTVLLLPPCNPPSPRPFPSPESQESPLPVPRHPPNAFVPSDLSCFSASPVHHLHAARHHLTCARHLLASRLASLYQGPSVLHLLGPRPHSRLQGTFILVEFIFQWERNDNKQITRENVRVFKMVAW